MTAPATQATIPSPHASPEAIMVAFRSRHRIDPLRVAGEREIGASVHGTLAHWICVTDGLPVHPVGGEQWRHDAGAVRRVEVAAADGLAVLPDRPAVFRL